MAEFNEQNFQLSDAELLSVVGGTLHYNDLELPDAYLDKTLAELATMSEYSKLQQYKGALTIFGFWNMTVRELVDKYGEETLQQFLDNA